MTTVLTDDDAYVEAVKVLADRLKQPMAPDTQVLFDHGLNSPKWRRLPVSTPVSLRELIDTPAE